MDDKTAALIEKVAEKLGTTAEHLWGVLVQQAPISGAVDLAVVTGLVTSAAWFLRLVIAKTKRPVETIENRYPRAEWGDDASFAAWVVAGIWCGAAFVALVASIQGIVAAFANPEYWALRRLLALLQL